jgi:hypothetical protein
MAASVVVTFSLTYTPIPLVSRASLLEKATRYEAWRPPRPLTFENSPVEEVRRRCTVLALDLLAAPGHIASCKVLPRRLHSTATRTVQGLCWQSEVYSYSALSGGDTLLITRQICQPAKLGLGGNGIGFRRGRGWLTSESSSVPISISSYTYTVNFITVHDLLLLRYFTFQF